jgi:hypothetical protein
VLDAVRSLTITSRTADGTYPAPSRRLIVVFLSPHRDQRIPSGRVAPGAGGGRKMIGRKMGRTVILPRRPATAPLHFSAIHLSATLRPRRSAWCDSDERCVRGAERGHPAKWKRAHLPRIGGRKFIEKAGWPSMPALSSCHVRRLRRRSTRCTLHEFPGPPLQRVGPNRTVTPVTSGRHPAVLKNQ